MRKIATLLILIIAALHLYIAWFEMFAWVARGPGIFVSLPVDLFEPTVAMAANQGLYNAFLAVGLIWSVTIKNPEWSTRVATCFLLFVATAGLFGAATVSAKILVVQTVPSVAALIFLFLSRRKHSV